MLVLLLPLLSGALAARLDKPWTVSGAAGLPGGLGVDVTHLYGERFGVAVQGSTWLAITDVGVRARWYAIGPEQVSFVVSGGAHALFAPLLFTPGALAGEATLGLEVRTDTGLTLGGDLGPAVWLSLPGHTEGGGGITPAGMVQGRLGWSW